MKVLVACEYSGIVRDAFLGKGHDAWSCDIIPCESGGNHIQGDCFEAIMSQVWDMIIMHPPCTKIALCGNKHYGRGMARHSERLSAIEWTKRLWDLAVSVCQKVVMENPKNVMGAHIGKRTQAIQPWMFGHPERKETWLWLYGVQPLTETHNVFDHMMTLPKSQQERIFYMSPSESRGHDRSRTFLGVAKAMADQWGG